ncbi:MAG: AraC family transcriptional regulator [Balneolaceae bacterium]|nr:AraC family transcriptional regulator [Balneolaceae bacterium]
MKKQSSASRIESADKVLLENLAEILSVEEWAKACGYQNADYFSKRYRKYFGIRPKRAMVQIRLQKAKQMLIEEPQISCYEIAQAIGKRDEKNCIGTSLRTPKTRLRSIEKKVGK